MRVTPCVHAHARTHTRAHGSAAPETFTGGREVTCRSPAASRSPEGAADPPRGAEVKARATRPAGLRHTKGSFSRSARSAPARPLPPTSLEDSLDQGDVGLA